MITTRPNPRVDSMVTNSLFGSLARDNQQLVSIYRMPNSSLAQVKPSNSTPNAHRQQKCSGVLTLALPHMLTQLKQMLSHASLRHRADTPLGTRDLLAVA